MNPNDFHAAYKRVLSITGARTQVELANILGIRQSSVSDAMKRGDMPAGWLLTLLKMYRVNPEWVVTGEVSPYLVEADSAPMNTSRTTRFATSHKIKSILAHAQDGIMEAFYGESK